jgi:hypothetical protein
LLKDLKIGMSSVLDSTHGTAVLYSGLVGVIASQFVPTPEELVFYYAEKKLHDKWKSKKITAKQYYGRAYGAKHFTRIAWYAAILGAIYFKKGSAEDKAKFGLMILGAGALIGYLYKGKNKAIMDIRAEALEETQPTSEFAGNKTKPKVGQYRGVLRRGNVLKFVA